MLGFECWEKRKMKIGTVIIAAMALALIAGSPAEAAKKHKRSEHAQVERHALAGIVAYRDGGVRRGPLYNGQDYLGDDPDPSIRAYLLKDMTRYQGAH
jgi:hypothetical protein